MHGRLKPSLDGSPLEMCLALVLEDHTPTEAADCISGLINPNEEATCRLIGNARTDFMQAARMNRLEDLEDSLALITSAKAKLREAALIWLGPRECDCCVDMRARLEREAKEGGA